MKKMNRWNTMLCLCLSVLITWASAIAAEKADYVFKNGAIYTIESKNPKAEAVAVTVKKIAYERQVKGEMSDYTKNGGNQMKKGLFRRIWDGIENQTTPNHLFSLDI